VFATQPVPPWKQTLNPAQLEAATCGDGPVLVIAGAGTGKTWTLACRVAFLIERGVPPERILLLTFSRRAAREMLSRAGRLVDRQRTGKVWGGTFHATANRLLRLYGRALGLSPDFTVLDQADMADLMDLIRGERRPPRDQKQRRFPKKDTLVAIYSRMVNAGEPLSSVLEHAFPWCRDDADGIRAVFAEYTGRKRAANVLDYDDLLLYWRALGEAPAGRDVARMFEHVLVDEYQDTNPLQAQILQSLRPSDVNRNVMAVGDDAQAIYAFRAASVRNILDFPVQFPGARHITLEQNYRSTRPILDVSNAVIAQARERFPKNLWPVRSGGARPVLLTCSDENEQSAQVCEQVLEHREQGTPLRQQAVLFRTGHHSDVLELELTRRNIPFVKFGGLKFLESAHVKDALSVMRILENARDEVSWFRVLQLLDGIGPRAARGVMRSIGVLSVAGVASTSARALEQPVGPLWLGREPPSESLEAPSHLEDARVDRTGARHVLPPPSQAAAAGVTPAEARFQAGSVGDSLDGTAPRRVLAAAPPMASGDGVALPPVSRDGVAPPGAPATARASDATDPLRRFIASCPPAPEAARDGLESLRATLADCVLANVPLPPAAELARVRRFCEPLIELRYSSPQARLQDLEQLEHVAGGYSSRSRFLSELALDPPNSTSDLAGPPLLDEDYLILSTIHSAKGGEWDVVHLIHAADGMIPSDMSTGSQAEIEEERRLFYVALTRARDNLYVYFPLRFYHRPHGNDTYHFAQLTRFLPESVQSLFERRPVGIAVESGAGVASVEAGRVANVDTMLSRLWDG
jgi:ATP-dependent DNA helicase UvrD/PcrA